jgi:hypothetical protein
MLFAVLFLFGCGESHRHHQLIKELTPQMMECVVAEDIDGLFEFFDQDTKAHREKEVKEQIRNLFNRIDGTIVSYKGYSEGGGSQAKNEGIIYLYSCTPYYQEVTTDTGAEYEIRFYYNYINDKHPEYIGLNAIRVFPTEISGFYEVGIIRMDANY